MKRNETKWNKIEMQNARNVHAIGIIYMGDFFFIIVLFVSLAMQWEPLYSSVYDCRFSCGF